MLMLEVDVVLEQLTFWLVVVTGGLVVVTALLAVGTLWGVTLQRRELKSVEVQLDLTRQQIEVTRQELRAHLEVRGASWRPPGDSPTTDVVYESGSEIARDVHVWFMAAHGRFGMACNAPSPSRRSHTLTIPPLPDHLAERWDAYFGESERALALTGDEWWCAVTWQAADNARFCWMYVQRAHHVEQDEFALPGEEPAPPRPVKRWRQLLA